MNDAGTKLAGSSYNGAYQFWYSYLNGSTWTSPASLGTAAGVSYLSGALTSDGTRGVIGNYWFSWTSTTPSSLTSFGTAVNGSQSFTKLTSDGSRLLTSAGSTMGFYTWSGTTYANFVSLSGLTQLTTTSSAIAMSPTGTYIFYTSASSISSIYYATWNGSTYAGQTLNVCSAFTTYIGTNSITAIRDMSVGLANTLYISYWGNTKLGCLSFKYNSASGYWDIFTIEKEYMGGYTSGIAVSSNGSNLSWNNDGNMYIVRLI